MFGDRPTLPSAVFSVTFLIGLGLSQACFAQTESADYLTPELRADVEELKVEADTPPASRARLAWRLQTLWKWGNAYALTGGPIPVDFPSTVSRNQHYVKGLETPGVRSAGARLPAIIGSFTREFTLKETHRDAIGSLAFEDAGPFEAGSYQTIVQTFTVGDVPLRPGGGFVLRVGLGTNALYPAANASIPITITTSRAGASIRKAEAWADVRGMMYLRQASLSFQLEGEKLTKGDTVTMVFGDPEQDSPGIPMQFTSNDRVLIPTYIDFDGSGLLITPKWPSFEVVGQPKTEFVHAIAPSIVQSGESFRLAVRTEDSYKNVTTGSTPEYRVSVNGDEVGVLEEGGGGVQELKDIVLDAPGAYRFDVTSSDGVLKTRSNPVWVKRDVSERIYWGDTHGHTGFAEGQGSPGGYYEFARDVARMDFISLSEHDIWMDDWEWRRLGELTAEFSRPGVFTPILGYEWTAKIMIGGHHNVFFRTPENRMRVPMQETLDLADLHAGLNALYDPGEVLVVPHAHQAGDWTRSDVQLERLTEITSSHGTFEFFGQRYLENGFEVGFIGSSDNHGGHPGYSGMQGRQLGGLAAAIAAENTPNAIFDSLRSRSVYATTGERIIIDAKLNNGTMGQRLPDADVRTIAGRVMGTAPIDKIDIVKNGEVVHSRRFQGGKIDGSDAVQILFESSTDVSKLANPRGPRPWSGTITVENAELVSYSGADFFQPRADVFMQDFENPNRIVFQTNTRGRGKGLLLSLNGASRDTVIRIETELAREGRGSPGIADRDPARLPPVKLAIPLDSLESGPYRREMQVVHNIDAISAQLAAEEDRLDCEISFEDSGDCQPGDYYYVRVQQIDGAMAWSSPFWVGDAKR